MTVWLVGMLEVSGVRVVCVDVRDDWDPCLLSLFFPDRVVVSSLYQLFFLDRNVDTESSSKGPVSGMVAGSVIATPSNSTITCR